MNRSRAEVLRSARQIGPKGESADKANLTFWSNRASENSYHGKKTGETGTDRLGTQDMNHQGGSYQPNVRRGS